MCESPVMEVDALKFKALWLEGGGEPYKQEPVFFKKTGSFFWQIWFHRGTRMNWLGSFWHFETLMKT